MKHNQTFIIFMIVSLMIPSAFSVSTSSDININVPYFVDLISLDAEFDSAYVKQELNFDVPINVLESKDGLTLKKLISSDYKLEITDENGKRMTFWNDIRDETYQIPPGYLRKVESEPMTGYIRRSSGKFPFRYLWEISEDSNGQIAILKIASNRKDYSIYADDKLILESPYIKVPFDSAPGGAFTVLFSKKESKKGEGNKKIGEFSFFVSDEKSKVALGILLKSLPVISILGAVLGAVLPLVAGIRLNRLAKAVIILVVGPVLTYIVYFGIISYRI